MLKITIYETNDGERFDDYDDACYHEAGLYFSTIVGKVKFFDECANPIHFDDFGDFKNKCRSIYYVTGDIYLLKDFLDSDSPTEEHYGYGDWIDFPYYYEGFPEYEDGDILAIDENKECWVNYSLQFEEIRDTIRKIRG